MSKKEPKQPVNITLTPRVIGLAEEVMALRGHNSMSGFIEELIRDEYERRAGPMHFKENNPSYKTSSSKVQAVQAIADEIEAEAISKIQRATGRKRRDARARKPGLKAGPKSKPKTEPHAHEPYP